MKYFSSFFITFLLIFNFCLLSCSLLNDETDTLEELELSDVYGWTYRAVFTSSSNVVMKPSLIIYNDHRLDWDMSANSVGVMKYYYTYEKTSQNVFYTWWYKNEEEMLLNDKSSASMTVIIGIQNEEELHVMASQASDGAGSSMTGTTLIMNKTDAEKNTDASEIEDEDYDVTIVIPDSSIASEWFEDSTEFTGTFNWMVGTLGGTGYSVKPDDETSETDEKKSCVKITKTEDGTVTVTVGSMYNNNVMEMYLGAWNVENVHVKKSNDSYYLYVDEASDEDAYVSTSKGIRYESSGNIEEEFTIHGKSLLGVFSDGKLILRNEFAPGSMPLNIITVFNGTVGE